MTLVSRTLPPQDEDIELLTAMGYDRNAVVKALANWGGDTVQALNERIGTKQGMAPKPASADIQQAEVCFQPKSAPGQLTFKPRSQLEPVRPSFDSD